ncbi:hypothetical protein [Heliorestis acidaminivorans]|nr:hypothetical protein [Heliorestis acidaminivorans]
MAVSKKSPPELKGEVAKKLSDYLKKPSKKKELIEKYSKYSDAFTKK